MAVRGIGDVAWPCGRVPAEQAAGSRIVESGNHVIGRPAVAGTRRSGKAAASSIPAGRSLAIVPGRSRRAAHTVQKVRPAQSAPISTEVYLAPADRPAVRSARQATSTPERRVAPARRRGRRAATACGAVLRRLGPRSGRRPPAACVTGMNSVRTGIFFSLGMGVEWLRNAATEGSAAGGGTMRVPGAGEARSFRAAGRGRARRRRGSAGCSPARAAAAASAAVARRRPRETAWRRAPEWGAARRVRCGEGAGGARCVPKGPRGPNHPAIARIRSTGQVPPGGSGRWRLARDNCCYQEPNHRLNPFRPVPGKPPGRVSASVSRPAR